MWYYLKGFGWVVSGSAYYLLGRIIPLTCSVEELLSGILFTDFGWVVPGSASYLLGERISTWSKDVAEWKICEQKCVDPTPGIFWTRTSTNDWKHICEFLNNSVLFKLYFEKNSKHLF